MPIESSPVNLAAIFDAVRQRLKVVLKAQTVRAA